MSREKTKAQRTAYVGNGLRCVWLFLRSKAVSLGSCFGMRNMDNRPPPYDGHNNGAPAGRYYTVFVGREVGVFTNGSVLLFYYSSYTEAFVGPTSRTSPTEFPAILRSVTQPRRPRARRSSKPSLKTPCAASRIPHLSRLSRTPRLSRLSRPERAQHYLRHLSL